MMKLELLVEIQEINNKLSTLSADKSPGVLEKRIALLGQTKKLQDLQSKFEATLIGLPFEVKDFYSEKYKEGMKGLAAFKAEEILEALNKAVADKNKGLDSVSYLLMNLDFNLINQKLTDKELMIKILEKFDSKDVYSVQSS